MSVRFSIGANNPESGVKLTPSEFCARILSTTEETMEALHEIWREAGYEDSECQGLLGDFLTKYKKICATELEAEKSILSHAKETVNTKLLHLQDLHKQLGRIGPSDTNSMGENITDKLSSLEKLISEINVDVMSRQELMTKEIDAIDLLVEELGEDGPGEDLFNGHEDSPQLSDTRLNILKECLAKFQEMKTLRENDMKEISKLCYSHVIDMKIDEEGWDTLPDSKTYLNIDEAIILYGKTDEFKFKLHRVEYEQLKSRSESLLIEKDRRREMLASTGAEIARLWTLLKIPNEERESFQSSFQMNLSMETLSRGHDELNRLKVLRLESLGIVIENIRTEISSLWDDVGIVSQELRESEFACFFKSLDDMNESMLEEHEEYYKVLKKRVDELRPLLQKVSKRESIVSERIELEKIQMNPERLTARGPKAREDRKKEEQMQARVKSLDKLNKELTQQINAWEETNQGPFMFAGEKYKERMTNQDKEYTEYRDSLRNARKKKDGKHELAAAAERAKVPRRLTSTSAPSKENSRPTKKQRINTNTNIAMSSTTSSDKSSNNEKLSLGNDRSSTCSEGTIQTCVTEVKAVRESSATIARDSSVQ